MDVVEALKKLGGRATSKELLELLAPEKGAMKARFEIAEALKEGRIKKAPDYELKKEVFTL